MNRKKLLFTKPGRLEIESERLHAPQEGQVLVKTLFSAISTGTEMLVYRGLIPGHMPLDSSITDLKQDSSYPLTYGYSTVGEVIKTGSNEDNHLAGQRVFCFKPHASAFLAEKDEILPLPDTINIREGLFLPAMETAINFVQDAEPILGERALILGQGVTGLLTTWLLSRFPLQDLITLDKYPLRRKYSLNLGSRTCLDPMDDNIQDLLQERLASGYPPHGADFTMELSGEPETLNLALQQTGFAARVIIGSWYGERKASIDLGGDFHRNRIQLLSSQVSTLSPKLCGRWSKQKRLNLAFRELKLIRPENLITHEFNIEVASKAYALLDQHPDQALQVIFNYQD